jgi:hypothetical protein
MAKQQVIILARDIPQYCKTVGWYIRATELANFLARNNYIVHFVHLERAQRFDSFFFEKNIIEHPIRHPLLYNDLPNYKSNSNNKSIKVIITKVLKRFILSFTNSLVDYDQMANNRFYKKINYLIHSENIINLITSTPPHSYNLIGLEIKKNMQHINWIADLRDPWTKRPLYQRKKSSRQKIENRYEKDVLYFADKIVVVSQGMKDLYEENGLKKIEIVENGYSNVKLNLPENSVTEFIDLQRQKKRMVIGYFGTAGIGAMQMSGKDLSFFINVLSSSEDFLKKVALILQGEIIISDHNIRFKNTLVLPSKPNDHIRANMKMIDLGLYVYTLESDADAVMGGKLYDYVASGIPIWALVPGKAKSLEIFKRKLEGGIEITDSRNNDLIKRTLQLMLKNFYETGKAFPPPSSPQIAQFSRDHMNAKFLKMLL